MVDALAPSYPPATGAPFAPPAGRLIESAHEFPLRVYYEDTDLSGIVYHANYLRYMERARSDMLRLAGIDQRAHGESGGGAYAVSELAIKYRAPARLDDALVVRTTIEAVRAASVVIHQRVTRGPTVLSEANVTAALVGADGKPKRQPAEWVRAFKAIMANGKARHHAKG